MIDERNILLYKDNFKKLTELKVCVIGLGGVGSIIPIALIRTGLSSFLLIDKDNVEESNLNRQLAYDLSSIGLKKVDVLKEKLLNIRKEANIKILNKEINSSFNFEILNNYDYIVDAIDDINAKVLLAKYSFQNNLKLIVSLGMGGRIEPSKVKITTLNKTYNCPLARKYRYLLKKENIDISKIVVVFSDEEAIKKENLTIPSSFFVPNEAGLLISSYIVNEAIKNK